MKLKISISKVYKNSNLIKGSVEDWVDISSKQIKSITMPTDTKT